MGKSEQQQKLINETIETCLGMVCVFADVAPSTLETEVDLLELTEGELEPLKKLFVATEKQLDMDLPIADFVSFYEEFPTVQNFTDFFVLAVLKKNNLAG